MNIKNIVIITGLLMQCSDFSLKAGAVQDLVRRIGAVEDILGTDATLTGTLHDTCMDAAHNKNVLGSKTDAGVDAALLTTKNQIDALDETAITLLKTILHKLTMILSPA